MAWDRPLAEILRPAGLADFVGQKHLVGDKGELRSLLELPYPPSLLFWGPPGVGKTTLARIIAHVYQAEFAMLNAVSAGVKDIRDSQKKAQQIRSQNGFFVLFLDEIHRFNKAQQSTLLQSVESGEFALIGATTENPSFSLITPLLSRCRVLSFTRLERGDLEQIFAKAQKFIEQERDRKVLWAEPARDWLFAHSLGDARVMVQLYESLVQRGMSQQPQSEQVEITEALVQEMAAEIRIPYDRSGDWHYDLISAFIKSIRGSDPDAAVYYLAWMLEGGEDPVFIARRLVILASEDIGLANGQAFLLAESAMRAVREIGMPEARIILAHAVIYLAASPKSNSAYLAIDKALAQIRRQKKGDFDLPMHLRNAPTKWMAEQGYAQGYQYPHDFAGHFVRENYFPHKPLSFYQPSEMGAEKRLAQYLAELWPERYAHGPGKDPGQA